MNKYQLHELYKSCGLQRLCEIWVMLKGGHVWATLPSHAKNWFSLVKQIKVNLNPQNVYRRDSRVSVFQDKTQDCLPAQKRRWWWSNNLRQEAKLQKNWRKESVTAKITCKGQVPIKNNTSINFYHADINIINDRFKVCGNFGNASIELGNLGDARKKSFFCMNVSPQANHSRYKLEFGLVPIGQICLIENFFETWAATSVVVKRESLKQTLHQNSWASVQSRPFRLCVHQLASFQILICAVAEQEQLIKAKLLVAVISNYIQNIEKWWPLCGPNRVKLKDVYVLSQVMGRVD